MTCPPMKVHRDWHRIVACSLAEARQFLGDPERASDWFHGLTRSPDGRQFHIRNGRRRSIEMTGDDAALSDGTGIYFVGQAHGADVEALLTMRSVLLRATASRFRTGTEIWIHVEIAPGPVTRRSLDLLDTLIPPALDRIASELGAGNDFERSWR